MKLGFGFPAQSKVTIEHNDQSETVDSWGQAHVALTGEAGRINLYDAALTAPTQGAVVAHPEGKTFLNLLDVPGETDIVALLPDDRKAVVRAGKRQQQRGHPSGEHYWLPTDANDRFVCEPGDRHRKMYASLSPGALTRAQIATDAGVAESVVTGGWLASRPQYGGTAGTAVHWDVAKLYFSAVYAWNTLGRSDHIFLERGYDYTDFDWVFASGESEIHPLRITSFGAGVLPTINWVFIRGGPNYTVLQDVRLPGSPHPWYAFASAYDHVNVQTAIDLQWTYDFTVRDVISEAPWLLAPKKTSTNAQGKTVWLANGNHVCSIYSSASSGLLVDGLSSDHAGWVDGYSPDGDATKPCPPFKYAHAIYLSASCYDVTLRNNLLTRAASCGYQLRAGQHVEGNLLVDHNLIAAINSTSGDGQFNNVMDNVAFSAGYKRVDYEEGAYNWGYDVNGPLSSMKGNVIAHHANPDDPAEMAAKTWATHTSYESDPKLVNDTQVWKWGVVSQNRNVDGLDATTLDQTTIQRYAAQVMDQPTATIAEFAGWAKTQPSITGVVKDAVDWAKARFGQPRSIRSAPAALTFIPDPDFEGFRWDNRYNWSTLDLPGRNFADTVDLAGHSVKFGNTNADIAALTANDGTLDVVSGKLKIGALLDAANIVVRKAGQVHIEDADHALTVRAISGRLSLLGTTASLDLDAVGHAEILLGPDCTVPVGKTLTIGGTVKAGWDGTGTASLLVQGELKFVSTVDIIATHRESGELAKPMIWEHIGKTTTGSISGVTARLVDIAKWNPRTDAVKFWLAGMDALPVVGDVFDFAATRAGTNIQVRQATVKTVGARFIQPLQCFRSGSIGDGTIEPIVTATVTLAAGSVVTVDAMGLEAGSHDLTGPGVTVTDQGAKLPVGVSVTGGKLVLVVS